jgi:hypothetical protein
MVAVAAVAQSSLWSFAEAFGPYRESSIRLTLRITGGRAGPRSPTLSMRASTVERI